MTEKSKHALSITYDLSNLNKELLKYVDEKKSILGNIFFSCSESFKFLARDYTKLLEPNQIQKTLADFYDALQSVKIELAENDNRISLQALSGSFYKNYEKNNKFHITFLFHSDSLLNNDLEKDHKYGLEFYFLYIDILFCLMIATIFISYFQKTNRDISEIRDILKSLRNSFVCTMDFSKTLDNSIISDKLFKMIDDVLENKEIDRDYLYENFSDDLKQILNHYLDTLIEVGEASCETQIIPSSTTIH